MSNITEFFKSQAKDDAKPTNISPARRKANSPAQPIVCTPSVTNSEMQAVPFPETITPAPATKKKAKGSLNANKELPSSSPIPRKGKRPASSRMQSTRDLPDATIPDGQRRHATQSVSAIGTTVSSGHLGNETQGEIAAADQPIQEINGQGSSEIHIRHAVESDDAGQSCAASHGGAAGVIAKITYLWRLRQRWHRAEKALILQGKALCRGIVGGDKKEGSDLYDQAADGGDVEEATMLALAPFISSVEMFQKPRAQYEKELAKLARQLPAYEWVKGIYGLGDQGYASIVGEAGDIGSYKSVSALWKRMGLAVFDGERQRKKANVEEALLHGYSPGRRSVMWNVGNGLIGGMGRGKRPIPGTSLDDYDWTFWQKLFVERCRYECNRDPEKMPLKTVTKGEMEFESYPKHAQARAKRYVEKRFLRKLYAEWRRETLGVIEDPDEIILPLAAE